MLMSCTFLIAVIGEIAIANVSKISQSFVPISHLAKDRNDLQLLVGNFNDRLSFIFGSRFAFTFASSLAFFVDIYSPSQAAALELGSMYRLGINFVYVLIAISVGDSVDKNVKAEYRKQYGALLRQQGLSPRAEEVFAMKDCYQLKFAAYGGIHINKEFILSYLPSLVTFTVLFMQLNRVI
ncbi:hypothetical protein HDE_00188 [Halotydeus destructor]|nr:hypothetical protein HDE_00188 [Halotydeus destructor]